MLIKFKLLNCAPLANQQFYFYVFNFLKQFQTVICKRKHEYKCKSCKHTSRPAHLTVRKLLCLFQEREEPSLHSKQTKTPGFLFMNHDLELLWCFLPTLLHCSSSVENKSTRTRMWQHSTVYRSILHFDAIFTNPSVHIRDHMIFLSAWFWE